MNVPFDFGGHFAQNEKVTNFPMNSRMWQNDERKSYISYILSMKKNRHCCNEQEKTVKTGMEKSMKFTCTILFRSLVAKSSTSIKN